MLKWKLEPPSLWHKNHLYSCRSNDFQFGFQKLSNTSLCSWVVYETIDQYLMNGSIVYGCLLDWIKSFDTVEHSRLFQKLIDSKMPLIIVRMLITIYRRQTTNVRWKGQLSEDFLIRNGVRQYSSVFIWTTSLTSSRAAEADASLVATMLDALVMRMTCYSLAHQEVGSKRCLI